MALGHAPRPRRRGRAAATTGASRPGCSSRRARGSAELNVIRGVRPIEDRIEQRPTGALVRGGSGRRTGRVRNRVPSAPTAIEAAEPDDDVVDLGDERRAPRASRCSRYGQPGRSGQSIGLVVRRRGSRRSPGGPSAVAGRSVGHPRPGGSPVPGHGLEQPVVGERVGRDPVAPGHRLGGDQGVDDRLLGRLDRPRRTAGRSRGRRPSGRRPSGASSPSSACAGQAAVAGREGEEQVARVVAAGPAHPGEAEAGPLGEPLALVGQERAHRSRRRR